MRLEQQSIKYRKKTSTSPSTVTNKKENENNKKKGNCKKILHNIQTQGNRAFATDRSK